MALFQACLWVYLCVIIGTIKISESETSPNSKIKPNIFTPEYGLLYEHIRQLYQGLQ